MNKYITVLLAGLCVSYSPLDIVAKNATVICTYREKIRTIVSEPVHTLGVRHKNATDIDCCTDTDDMCQERLEKSARKYCERPNRVPSGYTFSSAKTICSEDSTE